MGFSFTKLRYNFAAADTLTKGSYMKHELAITQNWQLYDPGIELDRSEKIRNGAFNVAHA